MARRLFAAGIRSVFRIIGVASVVASSPVIFSCSDAEPEIAEVQPSLVLDYASAGALPSASLSVFLRISGNPRRASSFSVRRIAGEGEIPLEWFVGEPDSYLTDKDSFVFKRNLRVPPVSFRSDGTPARIPEPVPRGKYEATYADDAGGEVSRPFTVSYDERLLSATDSDVRGILGKTTEYVALYAEDRSLVFFGKAKGDWTSARNITRDYKQAVSMRTVLFTAGNKVVCLLPPSAVDKDG